MSQRRRKEGATSPTTRGDSPRGTVINTIDTRHTAATLATATAVAAALTTVSAIAPTAAGAHRPDPFPGPATHSVASVGSTGTFDIALFVAHRKARMAQYYVDHALELYQQAAR